MSATPSDTPLTANIEKKHSPKIMASYGTGKFLVEFYSAAFSVLIFKFYETNLQLNSLLTGLAIVLYSIWNAINDPIIGYFTIRPTRWATKYGRRFPWIFFGCGIWVFTIIPIFIIPEAWSNDPLSHQGLIFAWMTLTIMIHDLFFSIWELNYQSLFPDKFRSEKNRSKAAVWATIIGVFGIAIGNLLPNYIVEYPSEEVSLGVSSHSYFLNALVFTGVAILLFFLLLPGVREDPDMIARYLTQIEEEKASGEKQPSFFQQLKEAFKYKNFVAFILFYMLYQSCTMSLSASVDYAGDYLLPGEKVDTTMIFAGMLVGALISVPFWGKIAVKINSNQKALMYAAVVIIIGLLVMGLVPQDSYWGYTGGIFVFGLGFGGYWMLITPVMSDVIDEIVVKTHERKDGIFMGMRAFFGRLAYAMQAISFALVHELTGFNNNLPADQEQLPLAKLGIRLHMTWIPMAFMLLGLILFWRMNSITPEKMAKYRTQLAELDL